MFALCLSGLAAPPVIPWAQSGEADRFRIAIVGEMPDARTKLSDTILAEKPDILLFTGVDRKEDYSAWRVSSGQPVIAMASDDPGNGWLKRFDGIGVPDIPKPVAFGAVDLTTEGVRWRLLYATSRQAPVKRWEEQGYWLPKALDPTGYDRLIVVTDLPAHTLAESGSGSRGAMYLLDQAQDRADPLSFAAVIAGNTGTNEVLAPGGRFGELHLVAGNAGVRGDSFTRAGGGGLVRRKELEPGFAGALETEGFGPERFESVSGFWMLELTAGDAVLDFWMDKNGRYEVVYRIVRDKQGWHLP